jgi:hypothetical protein
MGRFNTQNPHPLSIFYKPRRNAKEREENIIKVFLAKGPHCFGGSIVGGF